MLNLHRFLQYTQHDEETENLMIRQIHLSESLNHFLQRILKCGFDYAASQDLNTRRPVGRCWQ